VSEQVTCRFVVKFLPFYHVSMFFFYIMAFCGFEFDDESVSEFCERHQKRLFRVIQE
jgi:hypothetical protein